MSDAIAIAQFDGSAPHLVHARQLRICVPTRKCVMFWATVIACFIGIALGAVFMTFRGPDSPYFYFGTALLSSSIGVLIPGPAWKDVVPKKTETANHI